MAVTQLTDLVFGANFQRYSVQRTLRLNAFAAAGVLVRDPLLDAMAAEQGFLHNLPFYNALANDEPNASTDNPSDVAVPKKATTGVELARTLMRNQGWSAANLTSAFVSPDPLTVIGDQVGDYWAGVQATTLLKICQGILADNVANDSGDMVVNVATDASGAATDAELFGTNSVINAAQTLGDQKMRVTAIAVHSVVHARMQTLGALLDHFDPQTGDLAYQSFQGKRVIVDDDMPVAQGTNRKTYTSILFGPGAFRYGYGDPLVPNEIGSAPDQGNGEGVQTLWNRRHEIIHPTGFAVAGTQVSSSATPSYANLVTASNWDRKYERKRIPLAFIKTNG